MTFEEAWAHIKEGKEFKVTWSDTKDTSRWITAKDISHVPLNIIGSSDFQIKCEPREFYLNIYKKFPHEEKEVFIVHDTLEAAKAAFSHHQREIIKVREVIE